MMSDRDMAAKVAQVQALLHEKFGVKACTLAKAVRRTGRRVPRGMRARMRRLVAADTLARNPKLARQIDPAEVARDFEAVTAHLRAIDVADRRRGWWLSLAGSLAGNLLIVAALFIGYLWWRGHV
ncbi:hypothetical protein [Sulfitobacter sp. S190]|uniref:hypothetical protein n=1 Tax=Sulfitobacter sp. S190 TaxID=2867022 RepID=UPI0021A38E72|nr:hypothetical protein [Sulfitobacter sp. S190]UWR23179.1 hypothetical protein K3756_04065 [Sulfitobacter sp. S190]